MILGYIVLFATGLVCFAVVLTVYSVYQRRKLEAYGKVIYSDGSLFSNILYSKSLPLKGKPDYIFKTKENELIPLEYKTSKTPERPYDSHVMQLMAYCVLTEENFGIKPRYGIIKYPRKEFEVPYSQENLSKLKKLVDEIYDYKSGYNENKIPPRSRFCSANY